MYTCVANACTIQGFKQGKIFAGHTFFGGHVDVNSYTYKSVELFHDLK